MTVMCGRYTVRGILPVAELFGVALPPEWSSASAATILLRPCAVAILARRTDLANGDSNSSRPLLSGSCQYCGICIRSRLRAGHTMTGCCPRRRIDRHSLAIGDVDPTAGTIRADAKDAGLSWSTVRRAAEDLDVKSEPCPYTGKFRWRLPKLLAQEDRETNNLSNLSNHAISSGNGEVSPAESGGCSDSLVLSNPSAGDGRERGEL